MSASNGKTALIVIELKLDCNSHVGLIFIQSLRGIKGGIMGITIHNNSAFKDRLKLAKIFGIFLTFFALAFTVLKIVNPDVDRDVNADTSVTTTVSATGYYIKLTSSGTASMNVNSTPDGGFNYVSDSLAIETNTTGYDIYIGTQTTNNYLYLGGDTSSQTFIPATAHETTLANLDVNSWGFATSTDGNYKAVPGSGHETKIADFSESNLTAGSTHTASHNIYFGAKTNMGQAAGTYSNTVVYSSISNNTTTSTTAATVSPAEIASLDRTIKITTSLMTAMAYGDVTATVNGETCTNPVASTENGVMVVTCTAPDLAAGSYDVTVSVPKFGSTYTATSGLSYRAYYTIAYANGTATSGTLPSSVRKFKDIDITLGTNSMSKSNTALGTVTWNANGGSVSPSTSAGTASYTANGWATTSGGTQAYSNTATYSSNADLTLYPSFTQSDTSASFPTPTRSNSSTISCSGVGSSTGGTYYNTYTFNGWYTAVTGGTKVTSYYSSSNTTLYAQWTTTPNYGGCSVTPPTCNGKLITKTIASMNYQCYTESTTTWANRSTSYCGGSGWHIPTLDEQNSIVSA